MKTLFRFLASYIPQVGVEIWARNAGRYKFVELDLTLRVKELEKGYQVTEEIENRVKLEIGQVDRILIHFEPLHKEVLTFGFPLVEDKQTISEHFGEPPFFRLVSVQYKKGEIINDCLLKNPCLHEKKAKGIKVANWLLENRLDVLISLRDQSGKGPGFVLGNGGVEILLTKETNAEKALVIVESELGHHITKSAYLEVTNE